MVLWAAETLVTAHNTNSHHATASLCLQFRGVAARTQQWPGACCQTDGATILPSCGLVLCNCAFLLAVTLAIILVLWGSSSPTFSPVFGPTLDLELLLLQQVWFTLFLQSFCGFIYCKILISLTQETSSNWIFSVVPALEPSILHWIQIFTCEF